MLNEERLLKQATSWLLGVLGSLVISCGTDSPHRAPITDQITVIFQDGVTRAQVVTINSQIGATIIVSSAYTPMYRMKLPPLLSLDDAFSFYESKPEVQLALPAVNFAAD